MFNNLLIGLLVFFPAGLANMAPIFGAKFKALDKLDTPLDFKLKLRGKRIFGDNKTIRGFVVGFVFAVLGVILQRFIFDYWQIDCSAEYFCKVGGLLDYNSFLNTNFLFLSLLFTVGALGGDALESFIKRQIGIKPGEPWFPFDQTDYILGGLLITWPILDYSYGLAISIALLFFMLHVVSTFIGYLLGLKNKPI